MQINSYSNLDEISHIHEVQRQICTPNLVRFTEFYELQQTSVLKIINFKKE